MATRTKPQFEALYGTSGTTFNDNTTGDISAGDMRAFGQDIADSVFTSGIISTKVTIPSASILTAFTTPITLIAAQGAGTVIEVISITTFLDYNTIAYATNTTVDFKNGTNSIFSISGILASTSDDIRSTSGLGMLSQNVNVTFSVNAGNPTAGNSPFYVYITYRVITL